jgi:ABC-type lipoprotein release transport system permease subunit
VTLSSIIFGVFLAVIMTAIQDQNWADTIDLAARLGGGHVTLQHSGYLDAPKLTQTVKGSNELVGAALQDRNVERAVTRIVGQVMLSSADNSRGAGFIAFDPEREDENTLSVLEGLERGEIFEKSRDRGIILGERLAEILSVNMGNRVVYTLTDKKGEIVGGLGRVSGIIRTGAPSLDSSICLLPIDTVRELLGYDAQEAIQVAVFIDDQRRSEQVADRLQSIIGSEAAALPWFETNPDLASFIAIKVGGARFVEILIAVLVAAGIFNTFFVSVMERLREFGILIALGFSPGRLFRLVMMESFWMALVGLFFAALVTTGPYLYLVENGIDFSGMIEEGEMEVAGVAMSSTIRVGIFPEHAALIAVFAILATLLSGVYPAWKAGHVEPVETIKLV